MGKVGYIFKRIVKLNYGNMFKHIDMVHEINHKNRIGIFFDWVNCAIRYGAGYVDYYQFRMFDMNSKERKTIITRGINNDIVKKYNDKQKRQLFEDKIVFNKLFDKYLNREWLDLREASVDDFKAYLKGKKEIIVKPIDLSCGKGVDKIKIPKDINKLYDKLRESKQILIEDVAEQHHVLNELYPHSVNTLRIVTLNKKVVTAYLRIGNHGNVVDNFNHDGMVTAIDVDTGVINFPAIDKKTNVYEVHPETNVKIIGIKIPMWDKVKQLCIDACDVVPEVGYIAWDVCLGEKKPCLIEGNDFPGHDLYELPVHKKDKYGLLPRFEEAMKEDK